MSVKMLRHYHQIELLQLADVDPDTNYRRNTADQIPTAGALAAHVAHHELGLDGPIRGYYTLAGTDTPDSSAWRTEIGLPIFTTGQQA